MDSQDLASALSSNRTEELGFDVWDRFVIPPRLNISEWGQTRKPRVIVGGRGCGKTMLLRYLSHESAFSPSRPSLDQSTLEHIGIYWRADTQFASLLQGRGHPDHLWRAAFGHLSALVPVGHKFGHVFYAAASKGCSLAWARSMRCSNESRSLRVNFHSKGWAMAS